MTTPLSVPAIIPLVRCASVSGILDDLNNGVCHQCHKVVPMHEFHNCPETPIPCQICGQQVQPKYMIDHLGPKEGYAK
jgi:hypothetical protein